MKDNTEKTAQEIKKYQDRNAGVTQKTCKSTGLWKKGQVTAGLSISLDWEGARMFRSYSAQLYEAGFFVWLVFF